MHAGVIRDVEQQRLKKERQLDFEMQKALEEEYRKLQNVHDGAAEGKVLDKPRWRRIASEGERNIRDGWIVNIVYEYGGGSLLERRFRRECIVIYSQQKLLHNALGRRLEWPLWIQGRQKMS